MNYIGTASACLALAHDVAIEFAEIVLDRRILSLKLRDFIRELASFYGLPLNGRTLEEVAQKLAPQSAPSEDLPLSALIEHRSSQIDTQLSAFEAQMIDECLGPYNAMATRTPVSRIVWPGGVFAPRTQDESYSKEADLTGRARIVIYGPPLHLPRGRWTANSTFSVTNNVSGNTLIIDVYNGTMLAAGQCVLPAHGKFSCEIPFEITEPQRAFEVRFATGSGAIEGVFVLENVVMERA